MMRPEKNTSLKSMLSRKGKNGWGQKMKDTRALLFERDFGWFFVSHGLVWRKSISTLQHDLLVGNKRYCRRK